jgi:hypothetical protein
MSLNLKKTLQLDFLNAKGIAARNPDNTPAAQGYVLQADGAGNSSWRPNSTTALNAYAAITVNSPLTNTLYADGTSALGNTLKLVASDPITLSARTVTNQITIGMNTSSFLNETTKRFPTEDFSSIDISNPSYTIDCMYKTYFLNLAGTSIELGFNKTNIPAGKLCTFRLFIKNDSARLGAIGPCAVTWPADTTVRFPSATPYSVTQNVGKTDIIELTSADRGETWYGVILGLDL